MPIKTKGKTAALSGIVTVEEAQALHEFLLEKKDGKVDLSEATHIHTAVLQVLMTARPQVSRPFADNFLSGFVLPAFS